MKAPLRYLLGRLSFWRRCANCYHTWPEPPDEAHDMVFCDLRCWRDFGEWCSDWRRKAKRPNVRLRYPLTRVLFWRRCWWCRHSAFGPWPVSGRTEARCNLISHDDYELTVKPSDCCSRWERSRDASD